MLFKAWEAKRHIEREYYTSLRRLVKFCKSLILDDDGPWTIYRKLNRLSESGALNSWAYKLSRTMMTNTLEENARTWRQAARMSGEGRRIYSAIQREMQGPVGDRVREIVDNNAHYIVTLPQEVALQVVRHTQTKTFEDNRDKETGEDFRAMVGDMTEAHARMIARTETAKAHAALVQARAERLGIDWYIWHTSEDVRVRDSHRIMDDVLCRFSDPPAPEELAHEKSAGKYGPGNIYNCRCYAEPMDRFDWQEIKWPHKVYHDGIIGTMGKREFAERFGVDFNAI